MDATNYKFSLVGGQMAVQQEGVYYVFAQVFLKIIQTLLQSTTTEWSLLSMEFAWRWRKHPSATKQIMVQNPPAQWWSWM